MRDLYEILRVTRQADGDTIRKSYLKLAHEFHPDANPSPLAEPVFKEVSQAYSVLSDPEKRALYDRYGEISLSVLFNEKKYNEWLEVQKAAMARGQSRFGGFESFFDDIVEKDKKAGPGIDWQDLFERAKAAEPERPPEPEAPPEPDTATEDFFADLFKSVRKGDAEEEHFTFQDRPAPPPGSRDGTDHRGDYAGVAREGRVFRKAGTYNPRGETTTTYSRGRRSPKSRPYRSEARPRTDNRDFSQPPPDPDEPNPGDVFGRLGSSQTHRVQNREPTQSVSHRPRQSSADNGYRYRSDDRRGPSPSGGSWQGFADILQERARGGGSAGRAGQDPGGYRFRNGDGRAQPQREAPANTYRGTSYTGRTESTRPPSPGRDIEGVAEVELVAAIRGGEILLMPRSASAESRQLRVRIKPGTGEGQVIRLRGCGAPDFPGGPRGHLVLTVAILPHPLLRRSGFDLEMDLPVTFGEALLGARVQVPTPDGVLDVVVPNGSVDGHRIHLPGLGVPVKGGGRGDLFLVIRPVPPTRITTRMAELARQIDEEGYDDDVRMMLEF